MRIDLAPRRFIRTAFLPDDWIAVLLKAYDTGEAVQRVGPVDMVLTPRFQSWLRYKNARHFNVFVSVNALTPGGRSRTRESVTAVRHVFLDADQEADGVLDAIGQRSDLPASSYVVRSSKGRAHVLWRVDGFLVERVEALQKHLARELGTDVAATSAAQMTRMPGFFNHKYAPAQLVEIHYGDAAAILNGNRFPEGSAVATPSTATFAHIRQGRDRLSMFGRARCYLAAMPPAIQGRRGDHVTFRACCRLVEQFGLSDEEALELLSEWNTRCQPAWSRQDLMRKLRAARGTTSRSEATGTCES